MKNEIEKTLTMSTDDLGNETPTCGNTVLPDIFVGQVLYREKLIRNNPSEVIEVTVGKVGRKYFYLTGWEQRYPINKETLRYEDKNYSQSSFRLYRDKQEIFDLREKDRLLSELQNHFSWSGKGGKNTLLQLRQAAEVLDLPNS
jgi:hypothetical protein